MKLLVAGLCASLLGAVILEKTLGASASCESLASAALPNTSVTLAQTVPAGGFRLANAPAPSTRSFSSLPSFCRVALTLKPSADSDIQVEVWLPSSGWNGKFQAVGNGGWAGTISYPAMSEALRRGYATSSTDTGHRGGN